MKKAVALGYFDGVHTGHRRVLQNVVDTAKTEGLVPAVFTFRFDAEAPQSKTGRKELTSFEQKTEILQQMGMQEIYAPYFSSFKELTGEEFVREILVKKMDAAAVCCGENFRFGKNAAWGTAELKTLCAKYHIACSVVSPCADEEGLISSTRIREAVSRGDLKTANRLLGRVYSVSNPVIHGKGVGRIWQYPTMNQRVPEHILVPKNGVYAAAVKIRQKLYPAVSNIGLRPTVENTKEPRIETHLFGFDGDLYGQNVTVGFLEFLREERKFADENELKKQIEADARLAAKIAQDALQSMADMI